MESIRRALATSVLCLAACSGATRRTPSLAEPERAVAPRHVPAEAANEDMVVPLSEAAARSLLARRFRQAGLRVRYDVALARPGAFEITVDGYDPERRIGFEYVAAAERDTDLSTAERAALARDPEQRVLVVDATDAAGLEAQATRFLARHGLDLPARSR